MATPSKTLAKRPTFGPNGMYTLTDGTKTTDVYEYLNNRTSQLTSLLDSIGGEGYEDFKGLNESTQGNYLWLCADLARECAQLTEAIGSAIYKKADTI